MENLEAEVDALFDESDRRFFEFMSRILDTVISTPDEQ
jgi:hypothetical protein